MSSNIKKNLWTLARWNSSTTATLNYFSYRHRWSGWGSRKSNARHRFYVFYCIFRYELYYLYKIKYYKKIIYKLYSSVAFLFNWIGFLLLMCFCHTIASRYGALSGFGLSLTKWTLIVKHSTDLASRENSWLWWLIMAFGNAVLFLKNNLFIHTWKVKSFIIIIFNDFCRITDLCPRHNSIFKHQAWVATIIWQRSRTSSFLLLNFNSVL